MVRSARAYMMKTGKRDRELVWWQQVKGTDRQNCMELHLQGHDNSPIPITLLLHLNFILCKRSLCLYIGNVLAETVQMLHRDLNPRPQRLMAHLIYPTIQTKKKQQIIKQGGNAMTAISLSTKQILSRKKIILCCYTDSEAYYSNVTVYGFQAACFYLWLYMCSLCNEFLYVRSILRNCHGRIFSRL
jgi:hypothetical protein